MLPLAIDDTVIDVPGGPPHPLMSTIPPSSSPDPTSDAGTDWLTAPLAHLTQFIVHDYHVPLRRNLPALLDGAAHVEASEWPGVIGTVRACLDDLAREVPPHLDYEERQLFPAIEALARGDRAPFQRELSRFPDVEQQHGRFGARLKELARVTGWFTPPVVVGPAVSQLCADLSRLMEATYVHVHLERNVLLPRARQLADAMAAAPPAQPPAQPP